MTMMRDETAEYITRADGCVPLQRTLVAEEPDAKLIDGFFHVVIEIIILLLHSFGILIITTQQFRF